MFLAICSKWIDYDNIQLVDFVIYFDELEEIVITYRYGIRNFKFQIDCSYVGANIRSNNRKIQKSSHPIFVDQH